MDAVIGALGKYSKGALSATCKDLRAACKDRVKCLTISAESLWWAGRLHLLPQLREMHIRCPPPQALLINLRKLMITTGDMHLTPELFASLGALSGLRELNIHSDHCWSTSSLDGIAHLSALTRLELVNTLGSRVNLQPISAMSALSDLFISGLAGDDATDDLLTLATLTSLTRLELDIVRTRKLLSVPAFPPGLRELNMTLFDVGPTWLNGLLRVIPEACSVGVRAVHGTRLHDLPPGRLRRLEVMKRTDVDLRTLVGLERLVLHHQVELTDLCAMLAQTPGCTVELRGAVGNGVTCQSNCAVDIQALSRSRVFTRTRSNALQPGIAVHLTSQRVIRLAKLLIRAGIDVGVVVRNVFELECATRHAMWMKHAKWLEILDVVDDASLKIWPLPPAMTRITHVYVKVTSADVLRDCLGGAVKRGVELRVAVPVDTDIAPLVRVVQEYGVDPDDVFRGWGS